MKKQNQPVMFSSKDLYMSSYLKAADFPLQDEPELKDALKKYYAGTALVARPYLSKVSKVYAHRRIA